MDTKFNILIPKKSVVLKATKEKKKSITLQLRKIDKVGVVETIKITLSRDEADTLANFIKSKITTEDGVD
jgi:hypothetical protein